MDRRKDTPQQRMARRIVAIEVIAAGPFKVTPWGWDRETQTDGPVPAGEARRVRCGLCAVTWRHNQGQYMRRHYMKHHAWTYGEAWDGWLGGSRADRRRAHVEQMAALDALIAKGEG